MYLCCRYQDVPFPARAPLFPEITAPFEGGGSITGACLGPTVISHRRGGYELAATTHNTPPSRTTRHYRAASTATARAVAPAKGLFSGTSLPVNGSID